MPAPTFLIKNGGTDFMSRQKSIFDSLSAVESETSLSSTSNHNLMEIDDSPSRSNNRKRTRRFLGKESIFKAPMDPPLKIRRPEHIHCRGKRWIKYSLADVSDYDISNEGNTAAALSFLESLRHRKAEDVKEETDVNKKHLFIPDVNIVEKNENESKVNKKHLFIPNVNIVEKNENESKVNKAVFKNTKLIMPEYVVGQSKTVKKKIKKPTPSGESNKAVYLDHIHADDDDVYDE